MAYKYRVAKNYNLRADYLTDIWADLVNMGWTLHDDQTGSSYKVYKSNGELGDRIYEYVKIDWITANQIQVRAYAWWDSAGHTGSSAAYSNGVVTTSEVAFAGWIYGSKGLVVLMTKIGATYYRTGFGHFDTKFLTVETDLTAGASTGAGVTITVTSTTDFVAGNYYQILGSVGEGRDKVQVSSITDGTHLVIANLPRDYGIGAIIGQSPSTFGWWNGTINFYLTCYWTVVGTATCSGNSYYYFDYSVPLKKMYVDSNQRDGLYYLQPIFGMEGPSLSFSCKNQNYVLSPPCGAAEDVFYAGLYDSGTAESGTATSLTDTDKAWGISSLMNKVVVIVAGTGSGQVRKITDNNATTIDVATWVTNPDNTSQYVIASEAYRWLYQYVAARECT